MEILRINPKFVKKVSLESSESLLQLCGSQTDENVSDSSNDQIALLECESIDKLSSNKAIILPQNEIGAFKIGEPFLIKMLTMRNIGATIIFEDDENIYVSLSELQEIAHDSILESCEENGYVEAEIITLVKFGAYVMVTVSQGEGENVINCFKTYLLKNNDFSVVHTPISKIMKQGDKLKIKVSLKEREDKDPRVVIEAYEKYENANKVDVSKFSNITTAIGAVSSINATMTFVNLCEGVDALVNISPDCQNIKIGSQVIVSKIKTTNKDGRVKVSGVISNVLAY